MVVDYADKVLAWLRIMQTSVGVVVDYADKVLAWLLIMQTKCWRDC